LIVHKRDHLLETLHVSKCASWPSHQDKSQNNQIELLSLVERRFESVKREEGVLRAFTFKLYFKLRSMHKRKFITFFFLFPFSFSLGKHYHFFLNYL
jgi:hypothetical protein